MLKKIILTFFILSLSLFIQTSFSYSVPVQDVFLDIDSDYKYLKELQTLYDKGMIFPDSDGRFNPQSLLNRDEFVGILMEVSCKKCIQPNVSFDLNLNYENTSVFYDIDKTNKYFYCVADGTKKGYISGYHPGSVCEDGTFLEGQKPFCPNNTIILEEALSIILKASGILSNSEADKVRQDIYDGKITQKLSDDVSPKNIDGSVYSFYPDFQKALDYELVDVDKNGNINSYNLIEVKNGKIRPKQAISKEAFLKIAFVALKANSCLKKQENNIPVSMIVKDSICKPNVKNCGLSNLDSDNKSYDFTLDFDSLDESTIKNPDGYIWRFYNNDTGEQIKKYGKYIDNFEFLSNGNWTVFLRVVDDKGNSGEVYNNIFVDNDINKSKTIIDNSGKLKIIINDSTCKSTSKNCSLANLVSGKNVFDFTLNTNLFKDSTVKENEGYVWRFYNEDTGEEIKKYGKYIDNLTFISNGNRSVYLRVIDSSGFTTESFTTLIVNNQKNKEFDKPNNDGNDINNLSKLKIYIKDSICKSTDLSCPLAKLVSSKTEYDFTFNTNIFEDGTVNETDGFIWRFYNYDTGEEIKKYGKYIDNFDFLNNGNWTIVLRVLDKSGKVTEDYTSLLVNNPKNKVFDKTEFDGNNNDKNKLKIIVKDVSCTNIDIDCKQANIVSSKNSYDFTFDTKLFKNGTINEPNGYIWRFYNNDTGELIKLNGIYINDFKFLSNGKWSIYLRVVDKTGKSTDTFTSLLVNNPKNKLNTNTNNDTNNNFDKNNSNLNDGLSISIIAPKIIGKGPLTLDFSSIVGGGEGPYTYFWDFGDGNSTFGKDVKNTFKELGIYQVTLYVKDKNGLVSSSDVIVEVEGISKDDLDSDKDGVNDSSDLCPLINGSNDNKGCPILEERCNEVNKCKSGSYCSDKNICVSNELSNSCEYTGGDAIFGNAICNSCPCPYSLDFNSNIRKCDVIFPAITSPDNSEIYSKGEYYQLK